MQAGRLESRALLGRSQAWVLAMETRRRDVGAVDDAPTNRSARRRWGEDGAWTGDGVGARGETVDFGFTTMSEWQSETEEIFGRPHQSRPVPTDPFLESFPRLPTATLDLEFTCASIRTVHALQQFGPVIPPAYRLFGTIATADSSG
jgi:hypothetical protein